MIQRQGTPTEINKAMSKDQRGNTTFWIKFDNGDNGGYTVKADTQDYFAIGTPADYFKDDLISQAGKPYTKFKRLDALQYQQQDQQAQQAVQAQPQAKFDPMTGQPIIPVVPVQVVVPTVNIPASIKDPKEALEVLKQDRITVSVSMSYALEGYWRGLRSLEEALTTDYPRICDMVLNKANSIKK